MPDIILYPTETVYALGVNPFNLSAWRALCGLKGRTEDQPASWLVRDIRDVDHYGVITSTALKLMEAHLPGPLTIVLKAKPTVPQYAQGPGGTVSFRISNDKTAQTIINVHMAKYNAPLTCTSANRHNMPVMDRVELILSQFKYDAYKINPVIDDGPRRGLPTTIVRCLGNNVEVLRRGNINIIVT